MKLGIVGAGTIVNTLLEFIFELDIELVAICATPKSIDKLKMLQKQYGFKYIYTDIDDLLNNNEIDTVYLGVNNHLHYIFGKKVLEANKHLIMEKPFTSNYNQAVKLTEIAKNNHLFIFEAISTIYNPNFLKIEELIHSLGQIKIVTLNYTQYSSRYDAFRKGEILPAFDINKSGGALMDLNVYNIHLVLKLFGLPNDVKYIANKEKGIDTSGILTMEYDDFKVVSIAAKDCGAPYINCIQGNKGCIYTDSPIFTLTHFDYKLNNEEIVHYNLSDNTHRMKHEFMEFLRMYKEKDYSKIYSLLNHSCNVMSVLTEARNDINLVFPDDENL